MEWVMGCGRFLFHFVEQSFVDSRETGNAHLASNLININCENRTL